jgi:hypothetical protein
VKDVAAELGLHDATASRRVNTAMEHGYLKREGNKRRSRRQLKLGEPLPPEEPEILPIRMKLMIFLLPPSPKIGADVQTGIKRLPVGLSWAKSPPISQPILAYPANLLVS